MRTALVFLLLSVAVSSGQTLTLVRKADSNYWVEASAPAGKSQNLQASGNLHLWADVKESLRDSYSFQFNSAGVSQRYFRLIVSPPDPAPIRLLLLGDSISSDATGWGGGMYGYFKPNATFVNYATPRMSTKVFLASPVRDNMLLIKPDYVLMQFGFYDGGGDPDKTTTLDEFAQNLRTIAQEVRSFNGVPILITIHAARLWDSQGKVIPIYRDHNRIIKQVGAELGTPLIDLNQLSGKLLTTLGPAGAAFMENELYVDNPVYLSPSGAQYISQIVINALPDVLGPYLTGIFAPWPNP
jgi:lysophospholipase L1-like esterase